MNNKHMEFGNSEMIKIVKDLRGLTDSLRKRKKTNLFFSKIK